MRAIVLNKSKVSMKWQGIVVLLGVLLLALSVDAQELPKSAWDQWLNNAYQLTWFDSQEIDQWIKTNEEATFKQKLADYVEDWSKRLALVDEEKNVDLYPDYVYLRLAIAEMLMYLRTFDISYLNKAFQTINHKKILSKIEIPENTFWFYYISAHLNMEIKDSKAFVSDIYNLWLRVVLKLEGVHYEFHGTPSFTTLKGFYQSLPYLYRNLANLVINRAIVQRRLLGIDALGPVIWNLNPRMPAKGYGKWVEEINKQISGSESDNFRLTYTVLFMEAEKQRRIAEDSIDSGKESAKIAENLQTAIENYDFLYNLAKTNHGRTSAITYQINLISFVLSRLYVENPQWPLLKEIKLLAPKEGIAFHEEKNSLKTAMTLYHRLAQPKIRDKNWIKHGFLDEETYIASMNSLWRSIMDLCFNTAVYYERFTNRTSSKDILAKAALVENALTRYLAFFEVHVAGGYHEITPNNAYYGAMEAAELLAETYYRIAPYANDEGMGNYQIAFARSLQAAEIFPFEMLNYFFMGRQLTKIGRLESYREILFMLTQRVSTSSVMKAGISQEGQFMGKFLETLLTLLPEVISRAPSNIVLENGKQGIPDAISERLQKIRLELKKDEKEGVSHGDLEQNVKTFMKRVKKVKQAKAITDSDYQGVVADLHQFLAAQSMHSDKTTAASSQAESPFLTQKLFPNPLEQLMRELQLIEEEAAILLSWPNIRDMRDTLVLNVNHPFHVLLRRFYYENSRLDINYLRLIRGLPPVIAIPEDNKANRRFLKLPEKKSPTLAGFTDYGLGKK